MWKKAAIILLAASIAIPVISTPLVIERLTWPEAKSIIENHGGRKLEIYGIKLPCAHVLDFGYVVYYRLESGDNVGRICRSIFGGEWTWYPSTNAMIAEKPY